jgi:glucose-6-phosphate isomerase
MSNEFFFESTLEKNYFSVDLDFMNIKSSDLEQGKSILQDAVVSMKNLEGGAIANPDEKRQVGHYWLRNSSMAPNPALQKQIEDCLSAVKRFVDDILNGKILNTAKATFASVVVVGIGGSALGPQLLQGALSVRGKGLALYFIDNTDPVGMDLVLEGQPDLSRTLFLVISKSGGTRETFNGELYVKHVLKSKGFDPAYQMVAITQEGSALAGRVEAEGWLASFPMWDWVGGRTSIMSAVGLVPAGLAGIDIDTFLLGAKEMDIWCRESELGRNPALLMAFSWYCAGEGKGNRAMVVLPYRDRLLLMSRYLQQLVMESLGKRYDLKGKEVFQGLSVFGNKGSTDQHAFVQQLRDGRNDFFAVFINVLNDGDSADSAAFFEPEPGVTLGDYLNGFFLGTKNALHESGRSSLTITLERLNEYSVGQLIAFFERAVSYYASMIGVNAYNQPGVEAGKVAAQSIIALQQKIGAVIHRSGPAGIEVSQLMRQVSLAVPNVNINDIKQLLSRLVANGRIAQEDTSNKCIYKPLLR